MLMTTQVALGRLGRGWVGRKITSKNTMRFQLVQEREKQTAPGYWEKEKGSKRYLGKRHNRIW